MCMGRVGIIIRGVMFRKWAIALPAVALTLLSGTTGQAQVPTYHSTYGLENVLVNDMVALPGGDLVGVGRLGSLEPGTLGSKFAARWTDQGDTVWTKVFTGSGGQFSKARTLGSGELIAVGSNGIHLVESNGDEVTFLSNLVAGGIQDVREVGSDSLFVASPHSIAIVDLLGMPIWSRPLVYPSGFTIASNVVTRVGDRLVVCSGSDFYWVDEMLPQTTIQLGWYGMDGEFLDTVNVHFPAETAPITASNFIRMADGGALALLMRSTARPSLVRLDAEGDLAWVKDLATWELGGPVPPGYYDHWINAASVLERENGHILLAGVGGPIPDQGMEAEYGVGVMELDAFGNPLCFELVTPVFADDENGWTSATTNAAGDVHIAYGFTSDPELFYTYMAGIGQLCLPEVEVEDLFPLPDGGVLSVGNSTDQLVLKHWNASGVLQWAQAHAGPASYGACLLNAGTLLVPGEVGTRSFSTIDGSLLGVTQGAPGHVTVAGMDSLLYCGAEGLSLWTVDGALLWEVPLQVPVIPDGLSTAKALRTGSGILVYAGVTDGYADAALVLSRYDLHGSPTDPVEVHADDGSHTRVHALVPTVDGGSIGLATMGTGTTRMVRANAQGDTLWTRHFGVDAPLEGFPALFQGERVIALDDGRSIVAGITGPPFELALLVLDEDGAPICLESLAAVEPDTRYAMALDALERVQVLRTEYADGMPVGEILSSVAADQLCLSMNLMPLVPAPTCMRISPMADGWLVDRTGCGGGASYTIHDAAGRQHGAGRIAGGVERIMSSALPPGMYVLRVMQEGAAPATLKWAVLR